MVWEIVLFNGIPHLLCIPGVNGKIIFNGPFLSGQFFIDIQNLFLFPGRAFLRTKSKNVQYLALIQFFGQLSDDAATWPPFKITGAPALFVGWPFASS